MRRAQRIALVLLACAVAAPAASQPMITLQEGDIIVLDGGADAVYLVDPGSGNETPILSGPLVLSPRGAAVTPEGFLFVTDTSQEKLLRVDPFSGDAVEFWTFDAPAGRFPDPEAALADAVSDWNILVVDGEAQDVFRFDPSVPNIAQFEFSLVGTRLPLGIARNPTDDSLVVSDAFSDNGFTLPGFHRVDPVAGTQQILYVSDEFENIRRVAVKSNGDIVFTDFGGNGVTPGVYRLPVGTTAVEGYGSHFDEFLFPSGIALESDDSVLVTDAGTGELWRLTNGGNTKSLVNDNLVAPFDVVVVPELESRRHDEFLISEADPGGLTGEVYRANSLTDSRAPIPGGSFVNPRAMAFEHPDDTLDDGAIYVVEGPDSIVRRDLATGAQMTISSGNLFGDLSDIAVEFGETLGNIVVTDRDGNEVLRVDPVTGDQTLVAEIGGTPTSILVDGNGSLIVTATELVDDGFTDDDSGLFRVNPLSGDVDHFNLAANPMGGGQVRFIDPVGLSRDSNGDLLVIDRGDGDTITPKLYRVLFTNTALPLGAAVILLTAVDAQLADAVSMAVDTSREPIIAFDVNEPERLDLPGQNALTLMIGGALDEATDLLLEDQPAPGDPVDTDSDGVPDGSDNCPDDANADQQDSDSDGFGDVCQLNDIDLDGWADSNDNCAFLPNPGQEDVDSDGFGDLCDNCPNEPNDLPFPGQFDFNNNGIGDACEDTDLDSVFDEDDNCPEDPNTAQDDTDNDGVGDVCDNCPADFNNTQSDLNEDGEGDACQSGDSDGDGIPDDGGPEPCDTLEFVACDDNCPNDPNPSQSDQNDDGIGDVCQDELGGPDDDFDGWPNSEDNCPNLFNPDQSDLNEDGTGDVCQNDASPDSDFDGIPDDGGPAVCANGVTVDCDDNCIDVFNPDQSDLNEDGEGDACQSGDLDNDGIPDDGGPAPCDDGVTLNCDDNCPITFNPGQEDANGDGIGDVCQPDDIDADGWPDDEDNCPYYPNPGQDDVDTDGVGDACDNNTDADGLVDVLDNCPFESNYGGAGTCFAGTVGDGCSADTDCDVDIQGTCDGGTFCSVGNFGAPCTVDDDCDVVVSGVCNTDQEDGDTDGAGDVCDNCVTIPNAIIGTCTAGLVGETCQADEDCDDDPVPGVCALDQSDMDSDGTGDLCDNCLTVANGPDFYEGGGAGLAQCDTDSDGWGNACDGDLNGDDVISPADTSAYLAALANFFVQTPTQAEANLNCDSFVTVADTPFYLAQLMAFFPGPSAWDCAGTVPCPPPAP